MKDGLPSNYIKMKKEIHPKDTNRAMALDLWMNSPMPMVTLTKTFDVTRLCKMSRRHGIGFNMLLCWCIGKAASGIKEFYLLPERRRVGDGTSGMQWKLYEYDRLAINVIVNNKEGGINSCDIPYTDDLARFGEDYIALTQAASTSCQSSFVDGAMIIGTSAMVATELDSIVNQYTDLFCNPMVMWGKYRKQWFKVTLPISFQFHHVQMDGSHAARFLEELQKTINGLK